MDPHDVRCFISWKKLIVPKNKDHLCLLSEDAGTEEGGKRSNIQRMLPDSWTRYFSFLNRVLHLVQKLYVLADLMGGGGQQTVRVEMYLSDCFNQETGDTRLPNKSSRTHGPFPFCIRRKQCENRKIHAEGKSLRPLIAILNVISMYQGGNRYWELN